ncbi:MAG: serine/threonine protein kinase, partial [Ktedonobacteraceae bacterium]|nr:serine/threonine protein kinase [Ktedonobacteraceae bacterium]
ASLTHLRHPNLVPVLDFGIEGHTAYLVMSYIPGGHLRQRHPKGTRVPLSTIVTYVKQLAQALSYIHQHNLVHRDVKPHNMLIGPAGEIMLSDFGIAIVSPSIIPGSYDFEGTVLYAAPEQLMGHPRRSSDQYALGIVVYEWLSGTWPFYGTFDEIVEQHLSAPPPPLRERGIVVPATVEEIVLRTLAKKPEDRFMRIEDFSLALEHASKTTWQQPDSSDLLAPGRRQFMSPLPFHTSEHRLQGGS